MSMLVDAVDPGRVTTTFLVEPGILVVTVCVEPGMVVVRVVVDAGRSTSVVVVPAANVMVLDSVTEVGEPVDVWTMVLSWRLMKEEQNCVALSRLRILEASAFWSLASKACFSG
jgi:hypothetical protein